MSTPRPARGRVAVLGAGPAGMAAALGDHQAGHEVVIYERYREARPAGNILNLWPPPLKALRALGVDISDFGAPTDASSAASAAGCASGSSSTTTSSAHYGGGFIGLLRPELYARMLAAIPPGCIRFGQQVERIEQDESVVTLHFADGSTAEHDVLVGADGIDSLVRRTLWGDAPKREHRLHIFGGFTFADVPGARRNMCVLTPRPRRAGQLDVHPLPGPYGLPVVGAQRAPTRALPAPADLKAAAAALAAAFPAPLPGLVAATEPGNVQRWVLRDRPALRQWRRGRDHAGRRRRPPHVAVRRLRRRHVDRGRLLPRRRAARRGPHRPRGGAAGPAGLRGARASRTPPARSQQAWLLGKVFHHAPPPLRPVRDLFFDHTPFLQKVVGDTNPSEINKQLALIED